DMLFGEGISKLGEIIDCAVEFDIIKKSGSWFSYDGVRIGQGKDKVKDFLKENVQVCDEIEQKVRDEFQKRSEAEQKDEDKKNDIVQNDENSDSKPEESAKPEKKTKSKKAKAEDDSSDDEFSEFSTEDFE
ncbi:MAG: DNA recombination/repair protein RecA, partial [Oscillospiraceae bacterium]|nr:DNA recombination/repair protein RecA [Oscillospiraceae bacterium]